MEICISRYNGLCAWCFEYGFPTNNKWTCLLFQPLESRFHQSTEDNTNEGSKGLSRRFPDVTEWGRHYIQHLFWMLRRKNNYMTLDPPLNSWKLNIITMVLELDDAWFGSALGHDLFNQSKVLQFGRTGPVTFKFTSEN